MQIRHAVSLLRTQDTSTWDTHPRHLLRETHNQVNCRAGEPKPGGRIAVWTKGEATGGHHNGQASQIEGVSTEDSPEPALELQLVEAPEGKTMGVITAKLAHRLNRDTRDWYDGSAETT